jgi:hypothetical protein
MIKRLEQSKYGFRAPLMGLCDENLQRERLYSVAKKSRVKPSVLLLCCQRYFIFAMQPLKRKF